MSSILLLWKENIFRYATAVYSSCTNKNLVSICTKNIKLFVLLRCQAFSFKYTVTQSFTVKKIVKTFQMHFTMVKPDTNGIVSSNRTSGHENMCESQTLIECCRYISRVSRLTKMIMPPYLLFLVEYMFIA